MLARDLHGLPVLRAVAVRGGHTHPVSRLALQLGRRAADEERDCPDQRLAHSRGGDDEPRPDPPAAVHTAVLALVDRDGPRLLAVSGRPRLCARDAARSERRTELFYEVPEAELVAQPDALVELCGLGVEGNDRR